MAGVGKEGATVWIAASPPEPAGTDGSAVGPLGLAFKSCLLCPAASGRDRGFVGGWINGPLP